MPSKWDHITVAVERGRLVFCGGGLLPTDDLDAGLLSVLAALRDQGWEIDPDQSPFSERVRLRRAAASQEPDRCVA